jgi:GAG-pre-integrase domain
LNESQLTVTFQPDGPTSISYPLTDPELPGFTFFATVIQCISFLNLDFVPPTSITPRLHAFSTITFPKIKQSSTLWHRRFGHLGIEATKAALTKEYVTGINFDGPFIQEHCIACIVGKSPQHSYSHNRNRASNVGELIHMDICSPYLVQTPDGKRYFYVLLDDNSNFGLLI